MPICPDWKNGLPPGKIYATSLLWLPFSSAGWIPLSIGNWKGSASPTCRARSQLPMPRSPMPAFGKSSPAHGGRNSLHWVDGCNDRYGPAPGRKTLTIPIPCTWRRSEEHTSELQSPDHLVCRLLLEKKKKQ